MNITNATNSYVTTDDRLCMNTNNINIADCFVSTDDPRLFLPKTKLSTISQSPTYFTFKVGCTCHSEDCSQLVTVSLTKDGTLSIEIQSKIFSESTYLTTFDDTVLDRIRNMWFTTKRRVKLAWQMLTDGYVDGYAELIFDENTSHAQDFVNAINTAVEQLKSRCVHQ